MKWKAEWWIVMGWKRSWFISRYYPGIWESSVRIVNNSPEIRPRCILNTVLERDSYAKCSIFFSWYLTVYQDVHNLFVSQRFVSVLSSLLRFKSLNNGTWCHKYLRYTVENYLLNITSRHWDWCFTASWREKSNFVTSCLVWLNTSCGKEKEKVLCSNGSWRRLAVGEKRVQPSMIGQGKRLPVSSPSWSINHLTS